MKTAVLVSSHIYYSDQLTRLDKCLNSLCEQTVLPDVFVSISFANDDYKRDFGSLLRKYPSVQFKLSAQQKFQMEHLYILSLLVTDYDMVMFCDDDDTYHPLRVEAFEYTFEELRINCEKEGKQFGGVRETINKDFFASEYWLYGVRPYLLTDFFTRIKGYEDLMRHKFADMYLREFLRKTGSKNLMFGIVLNDITTDTYYNYTIDNPNSICSQHKEGIESLQEFESAPTAETDKLARELIQANITVGLICHRIDQVREQMKMASAPMSRLREVVPDAKRILQLTKLLYV